MKEHLLQIEQWEFDTRVYWVSQQPPEMLCKGFSQGAVLGCEDSTVWPSTGHFGFSQQATFGESAILGDMMKALLSKQETLEL